MIRGGVTDVDEQEPPSTIYPKQLQSLPLDDDVAAAIERLRRRAVQA
jgi:hypothetical protein